MAHTSKLRVDYHPFSTVTWCLLQKGYHCVCLSASSLPYEEEEEEEEEDTFIYQLGAHEGYEYSHI
jgi:hypothetical protein